MKKIITYTVAVIIVLFYNNLFGQMLSIKLGGGYNWGTASFQQSSSTQINNNSYTYENVNVSLGRGTNIMLSTLYMFNKYWGTELGINYLAGANTTVSRKTFYEPENDNHSSTMLSIIPAITFTPGFKKINPYVKFGLIIGSGTYQTKEDWVGSFGKANMTKLYNGSYALGFNADFGVTCIFYKNMSIFLELNSTNLSYAPTKSEIIEYKLDGVDNLSKVDNIVKFTEYVDSYIIDSKAPYDINTPGKDLIKSYPFSSVGLNIGLVYNF